MADKAQTPQSRDERTRAALTALRDGEAQPVLDALAQGDIATDAPVVALAGALMEARYEARRLWDRWYALEDERPAEEGPERDAWYARCAEVHVAARAADAAVVAAREAIFRDVPAPAAPAVPADLFRDTVYGMDRAQWDRYGELGSYCPESCFHGAGTRCAEDRQAIHRMEALAEGAAVRAAELGYPGYDYDPNDFGGWAGTGEALA